MTLKVKYGSHVTLNGLWYPSVLSVTVPLDWSRPGGPHVPALPPCIDWKVLNKPAFRQEPDLWARGVYLMHGGLADSQHFQRLREALEQAGFRCSSVEDRNERYGKIQAKWSEFTATEPDPNKAILEWFDDSGSTGSPHP